MHLQQCLLAVHELLQKAIVPHAMEPSGSKAQRRGPEVGLRGQSHCKDPVQALGVQHAIEAKLRVEDVCRCGWRQERSKTPKKLPESKPKGPSTD